MRRGAGRVVIRDDYGPWTLFGSLVRSYFQQMRSLVSY